MAILKGGSPFLFDEVTGDIVGIKQPDGAESYFSDSGMSPFGGQASGATTVFIGDSLTGNGFLSNGVAAADAYGPYYTGAGATFARTEDYGFAPWIEFVMRGGLGNVIYAGVGGNTTLDILARKGDVLSWKPRLVFDECGTNDVIAGATADEIIGRKKVLFDLWHSVGAKIIAFDISPRTGFSGAMRDVAVAVNRWLRQQAATVPYISMFPMSSILGDYSSFTGGVSAARTFDDTHPNNLGAFLAGKLGADYAAPGAFMKIGSSIWPGDAYGSSNSDAIIRNSNPGMALGAGGTANTGVTGSIAEGYTCSRLAGVPTVAGSLVERPDGLGFNQRLVITFAAASDAIEFGIPTASGRYLSGRKIGIQAGLEFDASSENVVNRCILYTAAVVGGTTYQVTALNQQSATRRANLPLSSGNVKGLARAPRLQVPAGSASGYSSQLRVYASAAGVVTLDISQFAMTQHP